MKVVISNKPSEEALKNCAKVLEEIAIKELIKRAEEKNKELENS